MESPICLEDPHCLYCHGECETKVHTHRPSTGRIYTDYIFYCNPCKEMYEVLSEGNEEYVYGFSFTCNDISVFNSENETFDITGTDLSQDGNGNGQSLSIHFFKIDFSNKIKLYQKLKTYLVFS
jgi:hypothetical protein